MRGRTNVSGQGVVLNATTANCIVETGEQITAGDFVQTSYHPSLETNVIGSNLTGTYQKLIELDDGNILVIHTPSSTTGSKYLYWEIYRKSDLVKIANGDFNTQVSSTILINPQLINCGNNKIALIAVSSGNSYNASVIMMTYNPSTNLLTYDWISIGTQAGTTNYISDSVLLDSDTILVWVSTYLLIFTISTQTWVSKSVGISSSYVGTNNRLYFITEVPHIYKYAENKIILLSEYSGYVKTFSVVGETVTQLGSASLSGVGTYIGFGKINNKLYFAYPSESSSASGFTNLNYYRIEINDDDSITFSSQTSSEGYTPACNRHSFQINNDFAVLFKVATKNVYIAIMDKNNDTMLPSFDLIYILPTSTQYTVRSVYMQWMGSDTFRVFILYTADLICALNCVVAGNEISASADVTYVKQYSTRCNGVAKQSGTAGDTIQVYVPTVNS